jgi:hypothetical protein
MMASFPLGLLLVESIRYASPLPYLNAEEIKTVTFLPRTEAICMPSNFFGLFLRETLEKEGQTGRLREMRRRPEGFFFLQSAKQGISAGRFAVGEPKEGWKLTI